MTERLTRLPDWRPRLVSYLHACARRPFSPGKHDCALFLAGGIKAMTGVDPAEAYRGAYDTIPRGIGLLRDAGFHDHADLARAKLPLKPVCLACEGDGAIVPDRGRQALGIVQGEQIYVLRDTGLGLVPLTAASAVLAV